MMVNWKTTLCGVLIILGTIGDLWRDKGKVTFADLLGALNGAGFMLARDH
jgi:hypothetical protein